MLTRLCDFTDIYISAGHEVINHAVSVARLTHRVLQEFGYVSLLPVTIGAYLHDIGKIQWPDYLFAKTPLNIEDWKIIRSHPEGGCRIIESLWPQVPDRVLDIVANHHERPGGIGYPNQVQRPSLEAQIVSAVDVYVACQEIREYKTDQAPATHYEAIQAIQPWAIPEVVNIIDTLRKGGNTFTPWQHVYCKNRPVKRKSSMFG